MLPADLHRVFNDSFERCQKDGQFLDRFYGVFLSSSDEVRDKFKNTDMTRQKKVLMLSFPRMMAAYQTPDTLTELAKSHDCGHLDIKPHLYVLWLDSLVQAVKLTDPQFTAETESAWRTIMQPGIDYMISKYQGD